MATNNRNRKVFDNLRSNIIELLTGESEESRLNANWNNREQQVKTNELSFATQQDSLKVRIGINSYRKLIIDLVKKNTLDCEETRGSYENANDVNYYRFHSAIEAAKALGTGVNQTTEKMLYEGENIPLTELSIYDNEIKKANEIDFYKKVLDNKIDCEELTDAIRHYEALSGQAIEDDYNMLKNHTKEEERAIARIGHDLSRKMQEIDEERLQIGQEKQSFEARRAQANANRFRRR